MVKTLACGATLLVAACTSSSGGGGGGGGTDGGAADATPVSDATVTCEKDPRVDTYVANLSKTSADGAIKVTLVASDPAPPVRGNNAWTVKLTNGAGDPMKDAALTVSSFMPDHGHGSSVKATVTSKGDGTYTITPVNFFMPGVWRVTIGLANDGGTGPSVDFFFCVAG